MKIKHFPLLTIGLVLALTSCKKDSTPNPTPDPTATVSAISPTSGQKNAVVTITGTNFGTSTTALKVYFNGVQGTIQTATATQITATVPVGASTGAVKVEKNSVQVTGPVFTYLLSANVTTFAGSSLGFTEGTGTAAQFNVPLGIVKDATGNLFVCDRDNHRIRKITPAGVVSTFVGGTMGFVDGTGTAARFNQPYAITIAPSGDFYVGDRINHSIRKITPAGVVTTLAGNGTAGDQLGTGSGAMFNEPLGVAADASGNIFVADYINNKIKKITPAGAVTTFYTANKVFGLAFDGSGNLFFTEYSYNLVSKLTPAGSYSIVAGEGGQGGTTDGIGAAARFYFPAGITVDASGNLYVCDAYNNRIRKITSAGVVSTLAGNTAGQTNGIGTAALFDTPIGICGDFANNIMYIGDFNNHRIRKIILD
ncbi:MAG: IPT/TIG domain-containing protein [Chitinophagaceae bacterium]|nr:IPT/TIG domain-containing protein [Chitinophagaceae bacterium]